MSISRREALTLLAAGPAAAAMAWTPAEAEQASTRAQRARAAAAQRQTTFKPAFFTGHEYATVVLLVDLIIPRDDRSGSATDAGVPEFMDFIMTDQPRRQTAMRGVVVMATGAWFDPADAAGEPERHGNPNVLTLDIGTSPLAQGTSALTALVEVERWDQPAPAVRAFTPPELTAAG